MVDGPCGVYLSLSWGAVGPAPPGQGLERVTTRKMHDGEVDIDVDLVRRLLDTQFPHWAGLPLAAVPSAGTVNAIYRLGDDMCVRLPRVHRWAGDLEHEVRWLPRLAPQLPLVVPEPIATGRPSQGFPLPWAIYRWLRGETLASAGVGDEREAAADLARFVAALRRIDPSGAPRSGRDRPLRVRETRRGLPSSRCEASSTRTPRLQRGKRRSEHRRGTNDPHGRTAISSLPTCWSRTADSVRSSTSGTWASATLPST